MGGWRKIKEKDKKKIKNKVKGLDFVMFVEEECFYLKVVLYFFIIFKFKLIIFFFYIYN